MADTATLEQQLKYRERLTEITNMLNSAANIKEILVDLKDKILDLIAAERVTIFSLDAKNQQLFSMYKVGNEVKEIRVAKSFTSIAGFTALSKKILNIADAYDKKELQSLHPKLLFDEKWDKASGFRTKQVLSVPVTFDKYMMGVIEFINKKNGNTFSDAETNAAAEIARILGIAFYNQRRASKSAKPGKFATLLDKGLIDENKLEEAVSYSRMNNKDVCTALIHKYKIPKEELGESLSSFYHCPFFNYDGSQTMPEDIKSRISVEFLKKTACAIIDRKMGKLTVAVDDPFDLAKLDSIKTLNIAPRVEFMVGLKDDINSFNNESYGLKDTEDDAMSNILSELSHIEVMGVAEDKQEEAVDEEDSGIVKLANQVIRDAYKLGASDIHVEPYGTDGDTVIRFRVDGACRVYQKIPSTHRNAIVSRLKIMAQLDIAEKRKPQDGKIKFRLEDKIIELRVAVVPTVGANEDIVMRILAASKPLPLDALRMSPRNLKEFKEAVAKPYGIFLVVGPTGSGKTTTLHSALGYINTEDRKIWTAEDPVEITQYGLRQVQVQPKIGFTFAYAMRAFLRADPDVIMVGEMRDGETAGTGVEASLTGHLVFSTLHTNSAPETITRLLDMEIDPFNFADALLGILAQRLVRTLCKDCKEAYHPDRKEFDHIAEVYGGADNLQRDFGITYKDDLKLYKPKGCDDCNGTGYRGRCGIHELLIGNDDIGRLIGTRSSIESIRAKAVEQGMTTLLQDGIWKVFEGLCDLKQVRAVCIK